MKLLLSGDIEMNPGPVENVVRICKSIGFSSQNNKLLAKRLYRHRAYLIDIFDTRLKSIVIDRNRY